MTEEWKACVGYSGYEVSNLGRVRSLGTLKWGGPIGYYFLPGRILKNSVNGNGYLSVNLGSADKTRMVHLLVAHAFLGKCPEGLVCCHDDDNKLNPKLSNLKYATRSENNSDTYKNGIRRVEDNSARAIKAAKTRYILGTGICRIAPEYDL